MEDLADALEDMIDNNETRPRLKPYMDQNPEEWIRNNILRKNMLAKAQLFSRMGMGEKVMNSITKENLNKMSAYHVKEREQAHKEELKEIAIEQKEFDKELTVDRTYTNVQGDFLINFLQKTDDEIRQGYINKLINMKILKLEPAKKHQTMIIFDWDDTLLCTHFLSAFGFVDLPKEVYDTLKILDESASTLLLKAIEYGQTFIITNAAEGWVQCSGKLFMPKVFEVIIKKNIKVISARSGYEDIFPGDSRRWKVEAFLDIEHIFDKNLITNLICLGDSHIEIDAAHILAQKFRQAMIKTIKFRESPKPEELVKQHELVHEKFEQVFLSIKNLTIRLERRPSKGDEKDTE